jgi:hypothetical protein
MIDATLAKVFGTKNKREIKAIQPIIAAINDLEPAIQQLSDIDLAAKTIEFKEKLAQGAPLDDLLIEAPCRGTRNSQAASCYAVLTTPRGCRVDRHSSLFRLCFWVFSRH